MNERTNVNVSKAERELSAIRLFDAPRERVFDAWTDPVHISNWWGPRGFTTTTSKMDARPGGEWIFVMHGPDGRDYPNRVEYIDVQRPERLVYRHSGDDDTDHVRFHVTVQFIAKDDATEVRMRMVFDTAEVFDFAADNGAIEGLHDTMARLAEHLAAHADKAAS